MPNEEQKFPEEAKRDLQEAYDKLSELDQDLARQSKFYKIRANIAFYLIVAVIALGIWIFAYPHMMVNRDKKLLQSIVPNDTMTLNIDASFRKYGLNNDTNGNAPIDTEYLKYRIEQAKRKIK